MYGFDLRCLTDYIYSPRIILSWNIDSLNYIILKTLYTGNVKCSVKFPRWYQ